MKAKRAFVRTQWPEARNAGALENAFLSQCEALCKREGLDECEADLLLSFAPALAFKIPANEWSPKDIASFFELISRKSKAVCTVLPVMLRWYETGYEKFCSPNVTSILSKPHYDIPRLISLDDLTPDQIPHIVREPRIKTKADARRILRQGEPLLIPQDVLTNSQIAGIVERATGANGDMTEAVKKARQRLRSKNAQAVGDWF